MAKDRWDKPVLVDSWQREAIEICFRAHQKIISSSFAEPQSIFQLSSSSAWQHHIKILVMDQEKIKNRLEIINTVVISVATLAIAWCTYQGSLWNGIQTVNLIESSVADLQALEKTTNLEQQQEIDATAVMNFANAVVDDKPERINFYLHHGRPEMSRIFEAWLKTDPLKNPNAPSHPMAMEEYQTLLSKTRSEEAQLKNRSAVLKATGLEANLHSDNYTLFTVVFSLVLFLNGISAKVSSARIMRLFSISSAVICLIALILLFMTLPVASPG